jgi:hypothetical protein
LMVPTPPAFMISTRRICTYFQGARCSRTRGPALALMQLIQLRAATMQLPVAEGTPVSFQPA